MSTPVGLALSQIYQQLSATPGIAHEHVSLVAAMSNLGTVDISADTVRACTGADPMAPTIRIAFLNVICSLMVRGISDARIPRWMADALSGHGHPPAPVREPQPPVSPDERDRPRAPSTRDRDRDRPRERDRPRRNVVLPVMVSREQLHKMKQLEKQARDRGVVVVISENVEFLTNYAKQCVFLSCITPLLFAYEVLINGVGGNRVRAEQLAMEAFACNMTPRMIHPGYVPLMTRDELAKIHSRDHEFETDISGVLFGMTTAKRYNDSICVKLRERIRVHLCTWLRVTDTVAARLK